MTVVERALREMEPRVDVDQLVTRFAAMPGARVGYGPRHQANPDPALEERVAKLFDEIPALTRDQGFVYFMWRYAGAFWCDATRTHLLEIFGFSDAASTYDEFEEPLIDDDGSFLFAEATEENPDDPLDMYNVGFLFNVDPHREWAVYRMVQGTFVVEQEPAPYQASFIDFMADVVAYGGRFPRLP